jgi:hypothetical protein
MKTTELLLDDHGDQIFAMTGLVRTRDIAGALCSVSCCLCGSAVNLLLRAQETRPSLGRENFVPEGPSDRSQARRVAAWGGSPGSRG